MSPKNVTSSTNTLTIKIIKSVAMNFRVKFKGSSSPWVGSRSLSMLVLRFRLAISSLLVMAMNFKPPSSRTNKTGQIQVKGQLATILLRK
jgi:hypothetical protein